MEIFKKKAEWMVRILLLLKEKRFHNFFVERASSSLRSEREKFCIMIPTSIIRVWFLGLFSWILLGLGIYLSHKWYQRAWSYDFNLHRSYFDPHIGNNHETLLLAVVIGGLIARLFSRPEEGSKFHPAGFLMSLVGAIVVVFLARLIG